MTKKVLFIDRDGTIIREPEDFQIDAFEKLEFLPNVINSLSKIAKELSYELVIVSNQDGLGTDSFPEEMFWPVQKFIINTLKNEGVEFSEIHIDSSFENENKPTVEKTVEADRTCVSNIHRLGTPPVEAAAVIVDLAKNMLKYQASGIDLNNKMKG